MQESNQLSASEAREFLNEFLSQIFLTIRIREEERIEKAQAEALEKVKLIEREFPGMRIRKGARKEIPPPTKPQAALILKTGIEKLDSLLADQAIKLIECSEGKVRTKKDSKVQETGLSLNEDEVREVINKFSEKTRIPVTENMFKASLENLAITAIISELIGSRFLIIRKE